LTVTARFPAGIVAAFVAEVLPLLLVPFQLLTLHPLAGLAVSVIASPA